MDLEPAGGQPRDIEELFDQPDESVGLVVRDLDVLGESPAGEGFVRVAFEGALQALDLELQCREGSPKLVGGDRQKIVAIADGLDQLDLHALAVGDVDARADVSGEAAVAHVTRSAAIENPPVSAV